jgi:hypothetical protein
MVHKQRNVKAHVPEKHHVELERRLSGAYQEASYEAAKASLESTARWLDRINSDAASSVRERLEGGTPSQGSNPGPPRDPGPEHS